VKIHIESGVYKVEVTTTKGDVWFGLFDLDHPPESLEIVQAMELDGGVALGYPDLGAEAYKVEERKQTRLRDVVEFASIPAVEAGYVQCKVWTPGKQTQLGTITISRPSVFRNPEHSEPWGLCDSASVPQCLSSR
jgi:hypothetical protein